MGYFFTSFVVFLVLALGNRCSAGPVVCPPGSDIFGDPMQRSMIHCTAPIGEYTNSEDGRNLIQALSSPSMDGLTEAQLNKACSIFKTFSNCTMNAIEQSLANGCAAPGFNLAAFATILRSSTKLMAICDWPDKATKVKLLVGCGKTILASDRQPVVHRCLQRHVDQLTSIFGPPSSPSMLEHLQSGRLLQVQCCMFKSVYDCVVPELSVCPAGTGDLVGAIYQVTRSAHDCQDYPQEGCLALAAN